MTDMTLGDVEIKALLRALPNEISSTARVIAILEKLGITDVQTLAELAGVSDRMVRHARKQIAAPSGNRLPKAETDCQKRKQIAVSETDCRPRAPARAHFDSNPSCEEGKRIVVDDARALAVKLLEAGGQALSPISPAIMIMSEPLGWIDSGADLDLDIVPTVRALVMKAKPASIQSWRYFAGAVAKHRDARLQGLPPPCAAVGHKRGTVEPGPMARLIAKRIAERDALAAQAEAAA